MPIVRELNAAFFKLRAGSANLLAGRALHGTLPKIWNLKSASAKRKMLETYALNYLSEEIRAEQAVRLLDPFRKFLEVAAQSNGKILNFSSIARSNISALASSPSSKNQCVLVRFKF